MPAASHRLACCLLALPLALLAAQTEDYRLVRSLSGPSGRVNGSEFQLDETRSRFVYPQDKSFVVYFEWDAPAGEHTLSASWRQPDGRVAVMSPDVKMVTPNRVLKCYWTFSMAPDMAEGIWNMEVRINGRPGGAHSFEVAGTVQPKPEPAKKAPPTLDEIYRAVSGSLVRVHKLDQTGRRVDMSSGFVLNKGQVATSFQAVDGASKLVVEFAGGQSVETEQVLAFSRAGDWVILGAATEGRNPLPLAAPRRIAVGERLIAFNLDSGGQVIGGVDIGGHREVPGFGPRIQLNPALSAEASGGPLLDTEGRVVGIIGGSVTPGSRVERRNLNPTAFLAPSGQGAAVPIALLPPQPPQTGTSLAELLAKGHLTPPITVAPEVLYASACVSVPEDPSAPLPPSVSEFSKRDAEAWILSLWRKLPKGSRSKGMFAGRIYDWRNQLRVQTEPKKVSLSSVQTRNAFSFSPAKLGPGTYRVDLFWDGVPVWRTFIQVSE